MPFFVGVEQQEPAAARAQHLTPDGAGSSRLAVPVIQTLVADTGGQTLFELPAFVEQATEIVHRLDRKA